MIRPISPADTDEVIQLWLISTISGQSFLPEEHWRAMEPVIRDELMPVAETWVVEEEGAIVSFLSLLGNLIGGLFTHPDHQGRGHGRSLVEHIHQRCDPLFVEVFEANEGAMRFYRRCGFVDHERRLDEGSRQPLAILRLEHQTPR